jgi:hypothetical protein
MFSPCRFCNSQNLIPNGEFELYSTCPTGNSQIYSSLFWMTPTTNTGPSVGTPDYYNQCASYVSAVSVPYNFVVSSGGFQFAHSGGAYSGITLWVPTPDYHEYIEIPLSATLVANTSYHFEMYVNLQNDCKFSTGDIGTYFSDTAVTGINNYYPLPFTPQITNLTGNYFDTLNWSLVSGSYLAHGGESYLIIGNFNHNFNTNTVVINSNSFYPIAYVYIDNVSLTPSTGIEDQNDKEVTKIYPNPFSDKLTITAKTNQPLEITLYDITSRKLLQQQFTNSTSINTSQLSKGIYIYELRNNNGVIKKGRVVKN